MASTSKIKSYRPVLDSLRREIASGNVEDLSSPSFLALPPTICHAHRIPQAALAAMNPVWQRIWHPPRVIQFSIIENVFVAAEGLVLKQDGSVVSETIEQHSAASVTKAKQAVAGKSRQDFPELRGSVVLCRKPGNGTYGHWLVELLPKAYLAAHRPEPYRYLVQALPGTLMPNLILQTLASIGISQRSIVFAGDDPVWVERLIMIHGLTEHGGYMSPLAVECLQAMTDRIPANGPENLFILRPPNLGRQLANVSSIVSQARKAGFTVLDPSSMPFTAQVAAFKAACRITGVMGSALANIAFARPFTRVVMLAPAAMPDTFFWFLGRHRLLDILEVRCITHSVGNESNYFTDFLTFDQSYWPQLVGDTLCPSSSRMELFNSDQYAENNPDVIPGDGDLLAHYMEYGWKEGRNPSKTFDGNTYLAAYPDVRASGMNPLLHFLRHGRGEGRSAFAEDEACSVHTESLLMP